jgi:hypothetical protein
MEKIVLLRDSSWESKEAKRLLQMAKIKHVEIFLESDKRLPCLLTPDIVYSGLENIKSFVENGGLHYGKGLVNIAGNIV